MRVWNLTCTRDPSDFFLLNFFLCSSNEKIRGVTSNRLVWNLLFRQNNYKFVVHQFLYTDYVVVLVCFCISQFQCVLNRGRKKLFSFVFFFNFSNNLLLFLIGNMTLFLWYYQYQRTDLIWKRACNMHTLFHIRTYAYSFPYQGCYHPERPISARGLLSSRETDIDQRASGGPRVNIGWGMISVLKWKKACINLFITYFNIELNRKKLTSHTDTKLIWI